VKGDCSRKIEFVGEGKKEGGGVVGLKKPYLPTIGIPQRGGKAGKKRTLRLPSAPKAAHFLFPHLP